MSDREDRYLWVPIVDAQRQQAGMAATDAYRNLDNAKADHPQVTAWHKVPFSHTALVTIVDRDDKYTSLQGQPTRDEVVRAVRLASQRVARGHGTGINFVDDLVELQTDNPGLTDWDLLCLLVEYVEATHVLSPCEMPPFAPFIHTVAATDRAEREEQEMQDAVASFRQQLDADIDRSLDRPASGDPQFIIEMIEADQGEDDIPLRMSANGDMTADWDLAERYESVEECQRVLRDSPWRAHDGVDRISINKVIGDGHTQEVSVWNGVNGDADAIQGPLCCTATISVTYDTIGCLDDPPITADEVTGCVGRAIQHMVSHGGLEADTEAVVTSWEATTCDNWTNTTRKV